MCTLRSSFPLRYMLGLAAVAMESCFPVPSFKPICLPTETSCGTVLCRPLGPPHGLLTEQNMRMQSVFPQAKSIWVESGLQDLSLVQIMHTHAGREGPLLFVVTRCPCWREENLQGHVL